MLLPVRDRCYYLHSMSRHRAHLEHPSFLGRTARLIAALALLFLLIGRDAVAADAASEFEEMRNSQRRNNQRAIDNMPRSDVRHINGVLRMRMEGGNLLIRTPLPSTKAPGYMRFDVAEVSQPVLARVVGGAGAGSTDAVVPSEFLLQVSDYNMPQFMTNLSISQTQSTMLSIVQSDSTPTGSRNVQFLWQKNPLLPDGGAAQLSVNETGMFPNKPPISLSYSEPDCAALFSRHAEATEMYIRPLLVALAQESALAPDVVLAQQVFPENVKPDPEMLRRIERSLPELGDNDYHRRDAAMNALQSIGPALVAASLHLDRSKLTPEQNTRLDRVLVPLGMISPSQVKRLRQDRDFLLNCLYSDDPATRKAALQQLQALTSQHIDLDPDAPASTRVEAVRALRKKILTAHP